MHSQLEIGLVPFNTICKMKRLIYALLQRHGLNQMTLFTQKKLLHLDMTSYPNQEQMEGKEEVLPLFITHQ